MKGTFAPTTLNDPETIFTNASTKKAMYQFYVNGDELQSGDILEVTITTDTTSTSEIVITDTITIDTIGSAPIALSYPIAQEEDDTYAVTLNQTDGTLRSFDWSVVMVEY